ncbi:MAG: hypothetical protein CL678_05325 [Bdellovibrionaceae bacterium]|nr:hypothetical protein [Pseudobdellovibrionaceae bacterium]|tara:strand:- start:1679 stop:2344 length:666 start_codon:yes stop_codon:yes gene_type:complete
MFHKEPISILINDDEVELTQVLKDSFVGAGFAVEVSHHCKEALEILGEKKIDLLLTDIMLPEMSGNELIQELLNLDIFLPVIAMSGQVDPDDRSVLFYKKPFDVDELIEFVRKRFPFIANDRLIQQVSKKSGVEESRLGKVILFDPSKGWGLLHVLGQKKPLYVNARNIIDQAPQKNSPFRQLHLGQVVRFKVNSESPRGPRAEEVEVVFDQEKTEFKKVA